MLASTIRTARLTLRQLEEGDASALHAVLSDPDTMQYWWRQPHANLAETKAAVAGNAAATDDLTCWAVTIDEGCVIGCINLRNKRAGVDEVGYILHRAYWGKGIGKEMLTAIVEYGFRQRNLRRIFADTDPENNGSIKILRAVGFQQEGHLRAEWHTHIDVRDSLIFGLLAGEWQSQLT